MCVVVVVVGAGWCGGLVGPLLDFLSLSLSPLSKSQDCRIGREEGEGINLAPPFSLGDMFRIWVSGTFWSWIQREVRHVLRPLLLRGLAPSKKGTYHKDSPLHESVVQGGGFGCPWCIRELERSATQSHAVAEREEKMSGLKKGLRERGVQCWVGPSSKSQIPLHYGTFQAS